MFKCLKDAQDFKFNDNGYLYIDVGTAIDAPTAAEFILKDSNANVIGIEPYEKNIEILKNGRNPEGYNLPYIRLKDKTILKSGEVIKSFDNPFLLLECAIDKVVNPVMQDFYCTGDLNTGCSSLLEPNESILGVEVEKVKSVETVSLSMILDEMNFDGVTAVLKTDTQGKDFDVVRSMGRHLLKTFIVKSEYNTWGQYKNEPTDSGAAFEEYMKSIGFEVQRKDRADIFFINKKIQDSLTEDETLRLLKHTNEVLNTLQFQVT